MGEMAAPIAGINTDAAPKAEIASLATAMTAAGFLGIAWYLCIELNVRLLVKLGDSGALPVDFAVQLRHLDVVLVDCSDPRVVVHVRRVSVGGAVFAAESGAAEAESGARHSKFAMGLTHAYIIWDKVQLVAFFVQETLINILYIRETRKQLKSMSILGRDCEKIRLNLWYLIVVNVFIIALDCSIMGLCYSGFFFLQGFYKAAVYAVKLRTEFAILNQLRSSLPGASRYGSGNPIAQHIEVEPKREPRPLPVIRRQANHHDGAMELLDILNEGRRVQVVEDVAEAPNQRDNISRMVPRDV